MKIFIFYITLFFSLTTFSGNKELIQKNSIFNLKSVWLTPENKSVQFSDFDQKKTLLSFVYTSCAHSCPFTIQTIEEVLNEAKAKGKDVQIVLITLDPKRDTPESNKKYLRKRHLNVDQWTILSGKTDEQIRELAAVLGFSYKDLGDGEFSHANNLYLFSKEGVLLNKLEGLSSPKDKLIQSIKTN